MPTPICSKIAELMTRQLRLQFTQGLLHLKKKWKQARNPHLRELRRVIKTQSCQMFLIPKVLLQFLKNICKADLDVVQKTPNLNLQKNKAERTVLIVHWTGIKVLTTFASVFVSGDQKLEPPGKQQIYLPLIATLILCSENRSHVALIKSLFQPYLPKTWGWHCSLQCTTGGDFS